MGTCKSDTTVHFRVTSLSQQSLTSFICFYENIDL